MFYLSKYGIIWLIEILIIDIGLGNKFNEKSNNIVII